MGAYNCPAAPHTTVTTETNQETIEPIVQGVEAHAAGEIVWIDTVTAGIYNVLS